MKTAKNYLFTSVKNEGHFLIEWIAYHRAIGFDKIIIASNDSNDGTTELLDALEKNGTITSIYFTSQTLNSAHKNLPRNNFLNFLNQKMVTGVYGWTQMNFSIFILGKGT